MKIQRVSNKQIDRTAWDDCIRHAENRRIYALSWYLDSLTNNKWEALVIDDHKAVMPLPFVRKAGFKIYMQPWFCQQLGPFWKSHYPPGLVAACRKHIPSPLYALNLNSHTRFFPENAILHLKPNMVLPLNKPFEKLRSHYTKNHRRNLKKAQKAGLEVKPVSITEYIKLKKNSGIKISQKHLLQLDNILKLLFDKDMLIPQGTWQNGELLSAVCWIKDFDRLVYFQAASNDKGKKYSGAFLLVNHMIEQYQHSNWVIDFEGSSNTGIRRFYRGFGATNEAYPVLISKSMAILQKIKPR